MRGLVLVAGIAVVALAGCGGSEPLQPDGDRVRPLSAASATVAAASPATVPSTPASPLATVSGSVDESRLDLLDVRRSGNAVQARLRLRPPEWQKFDPHLLSADGATADVSGARLVDPVNLREHLPLQDSAGRCVCTHFAPDSDSVGGETVDLSVQFAAPPPDVHEVSISMPTFASFDGVRIG